ncbi:hypothetical protein B9Z19DRAFT_1068402 [Tuber borchii]|uniref:Uncharacterized protein n=1 Tax=Tuber borchii TaxID=42251 RepID=A0A2T6ZFC4_TUBBO|nr:hypothetical protein B9Z19DRAFT_1068402 [Tuber borchii]
MAAVPAENVGEPPTSLPTGPAIGIYPTRTETWSLPNSSLASAPLSPQLSPPQDMKYYLTEGLKSVEHQQYRDSESCLGALDSQVKKLRSDKAGQYLVFAPVTQDQLVMIERIRHAHYNGVRLHYFNREETLIVKIFAGPVQAEALGRVSKSELLICFLFPYRSRVLRRPCYNGHH